nr:hypothetical protein [Candidatus Gracilibacteria bacterium]
MTNINNLEQTKANNTTPTNQEVSYFVNKYCISIQSLLGHFEPLKDGGEFFFIETGNLATKSIINSLEIESSNQENNIITVIKNFPDSILNNDNPDSVYETYKYILNRLCKQCEKEGKTLILGFSSMGGYEILKRMSHIIQYFKSKYKNLVFVVGGADFNALPEKEFLDKVFAYGIDIVNIGGAEEFTKLFGNLNGDDKFYRDKNGDIRLETSKHIHENLIFSYQKNQIPNVNPGKKIKTTFHYNSFKEEVYFAINNNPCLNDCSYCANFIHESTPLKDSDIVTAIDDFKNYISGIESNELRIKIDNPNPLQYIDKFEKFLLSIDLSKVKEVGFFGDFMGMGNDKIYEKVVSMIDKLLEKWPKLYLTCQFGIDALHYKGDGEFIGRTVGMKIAEEKKYEAGFKNFEKYFNKYKDNPRVFIPFNVIFHPNMGLNEYKERADFINRYKSKSRNLGLFTLSPHPNTKIEKQHKGFYIPEYKINDVIDLIENPSFQNVSHWGHFYLNSKLLDLFVFFEITGLLYMFDDIIEEEKNKEKSKLDFIEICAWLGIKLEKEWDNCNDIRNKIFRYKETKLRRKSTKKRVKNVIALIEFMIYRENYICSVNPIYNTLEVKEFIKDLIKLKYAYIVLENSFINPKIFLNPLI